MHPNSDVLLNDSTLKNLSNDQLRQVAAFLQQLQDCLQSCSTEPELAKHAAQFLYRSFQCEAIFVGFSDDSGCQVSGDSRLEAEAHERLCSRIENVIRSGLDSFAPVVLETFPEIQSENVFVVRSPALNSEPYVLILAVASKESPLMLFLPIVESMVRIRLESIQSRLGEQKATTYLKGIHDGSRHMIQNLFSQTDLMTSLLSDSLRTMNANACALLTPTDEIRISYEVNAQKGFGENIRPVPDALFSRAFDDFELNNKRAIVYQASKNETFILVPLMQRSFICGILVFSCDPSTITSEDTSPTRKVAEVFGDWFSLAMESATLFKRFAYSQTEWENTFDSIADPIYIIDNVYRLKKMNKSLASYSMKSIKVPLDPHCYRYLFNQNSVCPWCPVPRSLETGMPEIVEAPLFTTGLWQIQSFPYTDKAENRIGSIHVLRDITLLKQMQEQLIETEKLASAGKLISGVAHEVRNPLFGISATVRALANELKNKQDIQPYLDIITSETTRLNRLMEDLLNYTRPVKIDKNPSDLGELVNEVIEHFKHLPEGQNAIFNVIAGDKIPAMNMDRNKMKQVLFNLFENGIQHAKEQPRVDVFLQYFSLADPPEAHLVIKDNGAGISAQNLTKVFDPFYTTRQKGTGLGLSIVRKVIHDHGGRIAVESHLGIGTTFRITLPLMGTRV